MKTNVTLACAGLSLLALGYAGGLAAQFNPDPALDPIKLAPDIYTNEFENEHARAVGVTIRPGEVTPVHSHPGRVVVFLTPCVPNEDGGDLPTYDVGDAFWAPAETHGGYSYPIMEECRMVEIEIKTVTE